MGDNSLNYLSIQAVLTTALFLTCACAQYLKCALTFSQSIASLKLLFLQ